MSRTTGDFGIVVVRSATAVVALALGLAGLRAPAVGVGLAAEQLGLSGSVPAGNLSVDTRDRADVVDFFRRVYMASNGAERRIGWTGSHSECDAGTVSNLFLEDVRRRINYFRAMAGVPANVMLDSVKNGKAQAAALLYSVNGALSHYPRRDFPHWNCLSDDADEAARNSNIGYGSSYGAGVVDNFMRDAGAGNAQVGHRRWLLYPRAVEMGVGVVPGRREPGDAAGGPAGRAIWVIGDRAEVGSEDWVGVSWPPAGFVPYMVVYPRWSFSMRNADFGGAKVSMRMAGEEVGLTIESASTWSRRGAGESTVVWRPEVGMGERPTGDAVYTVTISDFLLGDVRRSVSYEVTVIDPLSSLS